MVIAYRHYKLEADIARMTWKVEWEDVVDITQGPPSKRAKGGANGGKFGSRLSIKSIQVSVGYTLNV